MNLSKKIMEHCKKIVKKKIRQNKEGRKKNWNLVPSENPANDKWWENL